ncbi:MAG: arylsulfotransferase family protein [Paracoccaceae bacterium]
MHPAVYDYSGVRIAREDSISPGLTLITSYFKDMDWRPGVKLFDKQGNVVHEWRIEPSDIFPGKKLFMNYVHGSYLFPNGDMLVNIEFAGIARIDRCGDLIWKNSEIRAHHSISPTSDGNFWVSGNRIIPDDEEGRNGLKKYQILRAPVYDDLLIKITPDGKVMKSISLAEVLYRNDMQRIIAKMGRGKMLLKGPRKGLTGDVFHLNDVEELPPEMAESYPLFSAGDIVVSARQLHLVMVLDPETLLVKWKIFDPIISQHDPDFIGDGWIGIFDNNRDMTDRGTLLGGSRILAVQPHTNAEKQLYPTAKSEPFYTEYAGKWQLLPNGNMLMVEARAGRALEVTEAGDTVWEWVNDRNRKNKVPEVLEATRYVLEGDVASRWACTR